eukprot:c13270_g1_i1 orf=372-989(-)
MGDSSSPTSYCAHCERQVPSANFNLHAAHCKRNLERCNLCGEMVAKTRADEHYDDVHAPVKCSLCDEAIERELLILHQNEKCPQRMLECSFCDFPVAAIDLDAHTDHCGNRTEMCIPCNKYVRLREKFTHDLQYHDENGNESGPSSRNHTPWSQPVAPEPPHGHRNPSPGTASKHKLLVTFAITGIAIIIGTFVLQRRGPTQRLQ